MAAMTSGPAFRLVRAVIFAAVCVVTTALGHALMSGDTLPGWAVAYAFAGTTAGVWWLTGRRERGALAVTGATVTVQLTLHALFSVSQSLAAGVPAAGTGVDGMTVMDMPTRGAGHMDMTSAAHSWSAGMVLAHSLAALLCGLWLWRGEAAAFRLGRSLAAFLFAPLRLLWRALVFAGAEAPVRAEAGFGPARRLRGASLRYVVSRRGPPPGCAPGPLVMCGPVAGVGPRRSALRNVCPQRG